MAPAFALICLALTARAAFAAPPDDPKKAEHDAAAAAALQTDDKDKIAGQTLAVFDEKCGSCHGPQAKKVKKFGYVTDFPKLRENPKLLTPGNLKKSKVWTTIEDEEMPPEDGDVPMLTEKEKDLVRKWVEIGSPDAPAGDVVAIAKSHGTTGQAAVASPTAGKGKSPFKSRFVRWLGHFHPLIIHFPIALLVAAAFSETLWLRTRQPWLTGATRFCVALGAAGSIVAAGLGWVDATTVPGSSDLEIHRWLGTVAALTAVPVFLLCERGIRRHGGTGEGQRWLGRSRLTFQLVLLAGVILTAVAAHLGGALVYGSDYFQF